MNDDLASMLKETGKSVPVPGKPGRVYVFSKKKGVVVETSAKRAASWQAIGAAGRAARQTLSEAAEKSYQSNLVENPMGRRRNFDDAFFFEQYSKSPYGAQQSIPVARRNTGEEEIHYTSKGQPYVIEMVNGKRKARFIRKNQVAAANPYFDPTQTRSALVPADFEWADSTMTVTALEPMGRMNPDLTESDYWGGSGRKKGAFAHRAGQFSPVQTSGFQPVNRRNPEMDENPGRRRKKRQASPLAVAAFKRAQEIMKAQGCSIAAALKQAWSEIPRAAKAAANPYFDPTQTRSALVPADFEWADSTMTVTSLEPMGRMNPGARASKASARLSARAEKAASAGRTVQAARVQKAADRLARWADRHRDFKTPALAPDDFFSPFAGASGVTMKGTTTLDGSSSHFFPHQGSAVYESDFSSGGGFDPELVPESSVPTSRPVFGSGLRYDRDSAGGADGDNGFWGGSPGRMGPFNYRLGQFSTSQTSGFQPVNRRNPRRKK